MTKGIYMFKLIKQFFLVSLLSSLAFSFSNAEDTSSKKSGDSSGGEGRGGSGGKSSGGGGSGNAKKKNAWGRRPNKPGGSGQNSNRSGNR